jgi:hypothetical protein
VIELRPVGPRCSVCKAMPSQDRFCDLVQVSLGGLEFTLCHDCAYELIEKLLGRYYALWGQALMFSDAVDAEREACAVMADKRHQEAWTELKFADDPEDYHYFRGQVAAWADAAAAIHARRDAITKSDNERCET